MSIGYSLDPHRQVAFIRAWGVLTESELENLSRAMMLDPALAGDFASFIDLRDVLELQVSDAFMRTYVSPMSVAARRAVLVSSKHALLFARRFGAEVTDEAASLNVGDDLDDALAWVGLPSSNVIPVLLQKEFSRSA